MVMHPLLVRQFTFPCMQTRTLHFLSKGGCVLLNKSSLIQQQRKPSSYYTFPVFTGTQTLLENLHMYSGLPWWATIGCVTIALRSIITFPLAVKQNKLVAKMELLKPNVDELVKAVKYNTVVRAKRDGKGETEIQKDVIKQIRIFTKDFYRQNNVSPWKLFMLPWIQLPIWVTISFALRNISGWTPRGNATSHTEVYVPSPGIQTEGMLWFPDLSVPDPYYVIPLILLASNLFNIEMNALRNQTPSTLTRTLTNTFRVLTMLMFLVSTQVPTAMSLYWTCSSSYGLLQNILMKFPDIRRKLDIPKTASEQEKPFRHMALLLQQRLQKFMAIQRIK